MLITMRNWFGKTIARKLLLAFFLVFIVTYLVTSIVVQSAVRTAVTDSELANLSQLAQLKIGSFNSRFDALATDLKAWAKLDVMNDLASGDVDQRVKNTLVNLKKDYDLHGDIYAFDAAGNLIAASEDQKRTAMLPDAWKVQGAIRFINKHTDPFDGDDVVAMVTPIQASFAEGYSLGTLVMAFHWGAVSDALPEKALLLLHQDADMVTPDAPASRSDLKAHPESIELLAVGANSTAVSNVMSGSMLNVATPRALLNELAHVSGFVQVADTSYLVNSALQKTGMLTGWEVVMMREPDSLYQAVHNVDYKLAILGLIMAFPLFFGIRWLSSLLTSPLRQLAGFVADVTDAKDLSKRLNINTDDEIGTLAHDFNQMAARLESGSKAHRIAETRLRATIDNALDAVVQMNAKGIVTGWNEQAVEVFGWKREEAVGRLLYEMVIPLQNREEYFARIQQALMPGATDILSTRVEQVSVHRDGQTFPAEWAITTIEVDGNLELSAFIRDITHKKESEELIWKQANYDKVTGLPNRHMFHNQLEQEIRKAQRTEQQMALLFIDLDHFKEVNDTLGHDVGDLLLIEAARRLSHCVRETDTVSRLGGDEFTVILLDVDDVKIVERIAQSILKSISDPFKLGDEVAYISASIGITLYPSDATNFEDMLKSADQAMYVSKNLGRNQSSYYTAALQADAQQRRALINDLRLALAGNQFVLYFQPIVDMVTGRIHKAEALIRWQHPTRGMVSPLEFISLAEETGLINEIGDWVFYEAARWTQRWVAIAGQDFQMSVNKSPIQFMREEDHHEWLDYLTKLNLKGHNLVIEITEGLLLNPTTQVTDKLFKFRDAGIQVAIDDFGTGYSSLSYLKKFDIDFLKIDKSFVDHIETDINDRVLSEAIIVMAHKLGLKVIAEGVETAAQRTLLREAGCDYMQGYLYSKPVSPEAFEALLKAAVLEVA